MRTWINTQLEILKRKAIKLGKLLLALLVIYLTVAFDAFWITIPMLVGYHIYKIPTYWNKYLDKQRARWKELEKSYIKKGDIITKRNKFGIEV